jgi:serine/threonine-protein kinase
MPSSPENWETLKALFEAAVELDSSARPAFLLQTCIDSETRAEVERLLSEHELAGTFLSRPIFGHFPLEREIGQRFSTGDLLAGRFEIVRFIASGGMGEVYEAQDQELRELVAIKTIRPQILREPNAVTRFKREVHLARKVTHPNVCRIFDLFRHKPPGTDEETVFVSMQLLEGSTLAQHLRQDGRMTAEEASPLLNQMASALGAAHEAGIVHGDFKPSNVMLIREGGGREGIRAVITDFGLALQSASVPASSRKSAEAGKGHDLLGTPAYMSPEQAQGDQTDARSDIFSFGIVLYEMLSGRRAFSGISTIEVTAAVLHDEPPPLDASPTLCAIIKRCLRKLPTDRFQTMRELRLTLESAIAVPAVAHTPLIAVLPFANLSGDQEQEYFSEGLAEEILNLLSKIPGLKVIARTSSFAFRPKQTDLRTIAERLNVDTLLEGSVRRAGNRIRVTAQLIDVANESHLWAERYDRELTDIFAIQDEIGQSIAEALKVRLASRSPKVKIQAYECYLKGQYHRLHVTPESLAKAKEFFERALALDPNYAAAYSGLAEYHFSLMSFGIKPISEAAPIIRWASEKALIIDPASSVAHSMLATLAIFSDLDWKVGEKHYLLALAADPASGMARFRYGHFCLLPLGRISEATVQSRLAIESDPLCMLIHFGVAWCLYSAKLYVEAIEYSRTALEIDPAYWPVLLAMGTAQIHVGLVREAAATLERVVELVPWYSFRCRSTHYCLS